MGSVGFAAKYPLQNSRWPAGGLLQNSRTPIAKYPGVLLQNSRTPAAKYPGGLLQNIRTPAMKINPLMRVPSLQIAINFTIKFILFRSISILMKEAHLDLIMYSLQ
ncbi:hypothetical protein RCL_jg24922.t1 [Rhizophagus clarus]|uniref:Uncharacterized protein n=1 Tax=Rhizophagus clarus TaxID=94130 RepID=A0A8H3LTB7_9GLOM|nr:hypothetical protein RCL_jg24922.t1 [Rhizophagus clarus]